MRPHIPFLALAALTLAPLTAGAQVLYDATDPQAIAEIARGYGAVEVTTDAVGDPMLQGRMNGTQYQVFFYGCTDGRDCTNIQFRAAWRNPGHVDDFVIRAWNVDNRFGTAFLDADGDPVVRWDVNLFGGVSRTNLDDTFDWWRIVLDQFQTAMD